MFFCGKVFPFLQHLNFMVCLDESVKHGVIYSVGV